MIGIDEVCPDNLMVGVVLCVCACVQGNALDLDARPQRSVPCFDLLMRLMKDPKYDHSLCCYQLLLVVL